MQFLKWIPTYSVHIKEMDNQHTKLMEMINELHSAITTGQGNEKVGGILKGLIVYVEKHFGEEEKLMRQFKFPHYSVHKAEHEKLTARVVDLHKRLMSGQGPTGYELLHFMRTWLIDHIQEKDLEYGNYITALAETRSRT